MPIVDGLEVEFEEQITFYRLNALEEENALLQSQLGLRGHPAIALLDQNGEIAVNFVGPQPASTLRQAIDQLLGS